MSSAGRAISVSHVFAVRATFVLVPVIAHRFRGGSNDQSHKKRRGLDATDVGVRAMGGIAYCDWRVPGWMDDGS